MDRLLESIGQIAVFIICAQTLLHFRAKASYEKYLKLLVSMMLLLLLVEPLMGMLGKGKEGDFFGRIEIYQQQLEGILENAQLDNEEITQILSNMSNKVAGQVKMADSGEVEAEYGKTAENQGK